MYIYHQFFAKFHHYTKWFSEFFKFTFTTSQHSTINLEGQNPLIGLTRNFPTSTWLLRIGNGNGFNSNDDLNITNITKNNIGLSISDNGNVVIGSASIPSSYANSRLLVYGGETGANIDVRGKPIAHKDIATLELEGSDYDTHVNSLLVQYFGPKANIGRIILGYPSNTLGHINYSGNSALLFYTTNQTPLVFGTNNLPHLIISTAGEISFGSVSNLEQEISTLKLEIQTLKADVQILKDMILFLTTQQNRN